MFKSGLVVCVLFVSVAIISGCGRPATTVIEPSQDVIEAGQEYGENYAEMEAKEEAARRAAER